VIHTVGPVYSDGQKNESQLLAGCYTNSLLLAEQHAVRSIAFPNISTGVYHFPKQEAAAIAVKTVKQFTDTHDSIGEIIFVCFDEENDAIYKQLIK
jgi:O-acetyl-ADP-ribose deacetylase (regulator of RNase III)